MSVIKAQDVEDFEINKNVPFSEMSDEKLMKLVFMVNGEIEENMYEENSILPEIYKEELLVRLDDRGYVFNKTKKVFKEK